MTARSATFFALILWLVITYLYIEHTPLGERSHDFGGHVQYTRTIVKNTIIPTPREDFLTYHPPLYYLINSLILREQFLPKNGVEDVTGHIQAVRYLSIFYGLLSLVIIGLFLSETGIAPVVKFFVLLFISTIPKFVFIFSTYNNDSLVTLLSIATVYFAYKTYKNPHKKNILALIILATCGWYTKYSMIFCIGPIVLICFKNWLKLKPISLPKTKIIFSLLISFALFSPYLYFRNYLSTGKLFPTNQEGKMYQRSSPLELIRNLSTIINLPTISEWSKPWAYPTFDVYDVSSTKCHNLFSFLFVTSLIGEYVLTAPHANFIWALFLIHIIIFFFVCMKIFKSNFSRLSLGLITLTYLSFLVGLSFQIRAPIWGCMMDFRYIAWTWICWAVLYANAVSGRFKNILSLFLQLGIIVQIITLLTIQGSNIR